jgi:hypothetical protein
MPQPPMPPKMPAPPKPPEMHDPEPQPLPPHFAEPRFPAAASSEPAAGPLDWLRAKPRSQGTPYPGPSQPSAPPMSVPQPSMSQSAAPRPNVPFPGMTEPPAPEPPMVEVSDEAPLSPRPPQRPAMPPPMHEPTLDSRAWSPAPASHARGSAEAQPMSRATPLPTQPTEAPPRDKDGFDMAWPEPRTASSEPAAREERPEPPPLPAAIRPREETPVEPRRAESAAKPASKPATERGPAILKSGVIDGMPYTLYADGSIEAEAASCRIGGKACVETGHRTRSRDPEIGGDRRHAVYALRGRFDRGRTSSGRRQVRFRRCAALSWRSRAERRTDLNRANKRRLQWSRRFPRSSPGFAQAASRSPIPESAAATGPPRARRERCSVSVCPATY